MAKKTKLNEAFENPHFILTRYIPFSKMGGQEKLAEDSHFLAKKKFCLHATRREGVTSVKNTTIKMKQKRLRDYNTLNNKKRGTHERIDKSVVAPNTLELRYGSTNKKCNHTEAKFRWEI